MHKDFLRTLSSQSLEVLDFLIDHALSCDCVMQRVSQLACTVSLCDAEGQPITGGSLLQVTSLHPPLLYPHYTGPTCAQGVASPTTSGAAPRLAATVLPVSELCMPT